jgi:hypothetical protein
MKTNMIPMAAALFLLCATCCKKDEMVEIFEPGSQTYGKVEATKKASGAGSAKWVASAAARRDYNERDKFFWIQAATYNGERELREVISISKIPIAPGTYLIPKDGVKGLYDRLVADGDAVGAAYRATDSEKNSVTVTEIDTVLGIARGHFNVEFAITDDYDYTGYPDKVTFKNAIFDLRFFD